MHICLGLRMYPSTPHGRFTAKPEVVGLVGGCWDWGCVLAVDATMMLPLICASLGGSGVVISGVFSPLTWVISIVTLLRTLLITTLNPKPYRTPKGTLSTP